MNSKIKICGITTINDAKLSLELGTDLLGFNFYPPSPRYIEPKRAAEIIAQLPDESQNVGVFVNMAIDELKNLLAICPLDAVQLHGDETDADCQEAKALGVDVIKAVRVRQVDDMGQCDNYNVQAILLDAFCEELYGGSGHAFDWSILQKKQTHKKIFLAGGITPDNIIDALAVGTYGIDLCSGVESGPGIKDTAKLKTLFEKIKSFNG